VEQQTNLSARTKSLRHSANHSRSCQSGRPRNHVPGQRDVFSCTQDVRYRDICVTYSGRKVHRTLAGSIHLAPNVHTFKSRFNDPNLATALTSLCILTLSITLYSEGCTSKLDSFTWSYPDNEYLRKFLSSQPSLNNVLFDTDPGFQYSKRCA
jgi:hypothetical protein